jgi:hypothetical protein
MTGIPHKTRTVHLFWDSLSEFGKKIREPQGKDQLAAPRRMH